MHPLGEEILVVEGDERLRRKIAETLGTEGFAVTAVASGAAALKAVDRRDFALIIAGVELPGALDGLAFVRRARVRRPGIRCLFTASRRAVPIWDDPDLDDFIAQPFLRRELLGCVFELLQRGRLMRAACRRGTGAGRF